MLWLFLPVLLLVQRSEQYEGRVVCYYRSDNVYRAEGFRMQPQEIDPYLCTHVIYYTAYLHPEEAIAPSDPHVDLTKGGYKKIVKLKESNPELKVMLGLSADPAGRDLWPLIAARKSVREWFATLVVEFLRAHRFDGLDIDWQIHNNKKDSSNYLHLLRNLSDIIEINSEENKLPRLELSVLLPAQIQQLHRHFHLADVTKYVNFINVASMDYWALDPYTVQHHAPLYRNISEGSLSPLNVDESIKYYLFKYVPPEKLVLGIPTYGRSFQLDNNQRYEVGSRCKYPGEKGFATNSQGTLAYFEICTYINEDCWSIGNMNLKSMGPFAHFQERWVGYDDVAMISTKAMYVREKKLGGLMFWTIDQDDFRGYCLYKNALVRAGRFTLNTGIHVSDAAMLQQAEQNWETEKDMGYFYPKPTIQQPDTPWTIPNTPSTKIPSSPVYSPTTPTTPLEVTSEIIPQTPSSVEPPTTQTISAATKPMTTLTSTSTTVPSPTTPSSVPTTAAPPIPTTSPKNNATQNEDNLTQHTLSSKEDENKNTPVTTPASTPPSLPPTTPPTRVAPTSASSPSTNDNEVDSDSISGVDKAILQLNKVLATVNKVVSDINEISREQSSAAGRRNLTIDPSFLGVIQPLLNLRNTADLVLENSEEGNPNNSTIRVQSDIKRYRVRSSGAGPEDAATNQTFTPSVGNFNSSDMFPIFSSMGSDRRYLLNSGRDIININLNISINNNYYDMN